MRNPETKETALDSTSGAKTQRVAIFDEGQWRVADQEMEDSKVNLNQAELMTGREGTTMTEGAGGRMLGVSQTLARGN